MSQTSYQQDPNPAVEGMLVDISFDKDIRSAAAQGTIPFGRFVTRVAGGASDDIPPGCDLPTTTGGVTGAAGLGFAMSDLTLEQEATPVGWVADQTVRYLRSGRIWMRTEDAVATYGAPVFVRFAAGGGGSDLGSVRTDADTATAVALPGASFRSLAGIAGLVIVEFNPQN